MPDLRRTAPCRSPRLVAVVVHPGLQSLDAVGPLEVFHSANRVVTARGGDPPYSLAVASPVGAPVRAHSGLRISADVAVEDLRSVDTLVVAGGPGARRASRDEGFVASLAIAAGRSRRVVSVCTGAYLLAAAGLLSGRRATTHWASAADLARRYPDVEVDPDPIFVRDGDVWTSAGVTAGMDLALALVADDVGSDVAHEVASWLVMFAFRPGGQSQFSATLRARAPERRSLADLVGWIADHPDADLTVDALARRAGLSPRHLARVFVDECGLTPADHVAAVRVERARQLLETTDLTIEVIAKQVGMSGGALHRLFRRRLDTTPSTYRSHFTPT